MMKKRESESGLSDESLRLNGEIFGFCPVQAFGTVDGRSFYFRARWNQWAFSVADDRNSDPIEIQNTREGFIIEGRYGKDADAGYMPLKIAEEIIKECARRYNQKVCK